MKKILLILIPTILVFTIFGCAIQPVPVGEPKRVYLKPLDNITVQYKLHGELTNYIQEEFLRESYINVVPKDEAEYIISGEIFNYELRPMSYSMNNKVESYEMIIEARLTMHDTLENEQVWEETFSENEIYFTSEGNPSETQSNTELELETQKRTLELLARDVMRKVVYDK